jgi:hypothetical protein
MAPSHEELGLGHVSNPTGLGDLYGGWAALGHWAAHEEKPTELGGSVLCTRKGREGAGHLACGKRKEEKKKWAGWGKWPKRV